MTLSKMKLAKPARAEERVEFLRAKYGPELLVDVAWVHDMPPFMRKNPHRLKFHDILLITRGEGSFSLDGCAHALRPGTVFFTAPHQLRHWDARNVDGLCLIFLSTFVTEFFNDPDFVNRLAYFNCKGDAAALYLSAKEQRWLKRRLLDMRREFSNLRADSGHILRAGLYEVLVMLGRVHRRHYPDAGARAPNPTVASLRTLVARHFRRNHSTTFYAQRLNISANHLNALCKRHLGVTSKSVIIDALAAEARGKLMCSDMTVEAIAAELGFKDGSYFSRFFKRATGVAPTDFRSGTRFLGVSQSAS